MATTGSYVQRMLMGLLACLGAVVACTAFSLFFGGTSAHASEESPGFLDGLSSSVTEVVTVIVDEAVAPIAPAATAQVSQVVAEVTEPVAETIALLPTPQTNTGAAVDGAVQTTVDTATSTVNEATREVSEVATNVLGEDPVRSTVDPLVGALEQLPVVGNVLEDVNPAVASSVSGVDAILASLGSAVDEAVYPIMTLPEPLEPLTPIIVTDASTAVSHPAFDSVLPPAPLSSYSYTVPPLPPAVPIATAGEAFLGSVAPGPGNQSGAPTGSNSSVPASSAASGGGSGGTAACHSDTGQFSLRAWERVTGAHDDALPPSPVYDTDVSPG